MNNVKIKGYKMKQNSGFCKKFNIFIMITLSIFIIAACTNNAFVGGGNAPDTEAPVLKILSPANLAYKSGEFIVSGTATDNVKVTRVTLSIVRNKIQLKELEAKIDSENWSCTVSGLESGEYLIGVNAYDLEGNTSKNSYQAISLTIDNEPGVVKILQPNLKPKEVLETLDHHNFEHIDYFQNQIFTIKGEIEESFRIESVKLYLTDAAGNTVYTKVINNDTDFVNDSSAGGSLYSWSIKINSESEILSGTNTLSTNEKHYLTVHTEVTDKAGNVSDEPLGCVCVYQDADYPWCDLSSIKEEWQELGVNSMLAGSAYDDDGIKLIYAKYVAVGETVTGIDDSFTKKDGGLSRCVAWSIPGPAKYGEFALYYATEDANGKKSALQKINFSVPDKSAPETVINTIDSYPASVANPVFTISGTSYDNTEISKVYLAWVPVGITDATVVENMKTSSWSVAADGEWKNGVKYWKTDLSSTNVADGENFKKTWSKSLNATTDFVLQSGSIEYDYKKIFYYAEGVSGKYRAGFIIIPKETGLPLVAVTNPADDAQTLRNTSSATFNMSGTCSDPGSGIKSLSVAYYDNTAGGKRSVAVNVVDGNWSVVSSAFTGLGGGIQDFDITAIDKFGNESTVRRSITVDNDQPYVTSVSTDKTPGKYSSGSVDIKVTMNKPVKVNGNLQLKLNSGASVIVTHTGTGVSGTDLAFSYALASGQSAEPLDYYDSSSLTRVGGATVVDNVGNEAILTLPAPGSSGSLYPKQIYIDTVSPSVKSITASCADGAYNIGKSFDISVTFTEVITKTGADDPTISLNSSGNGVYDAVKSSADTLVFTYTVGVGQNAADLDIQSFTGTVKDAAGNAVNLDSGFTFPKGVAVGSLSYNKNIKIDTTAPTVTGVTTTTATNSHLNAGKVVDITVTYDEPVYVGSEPIITLNITGAKAEYRGGNGTNELLFRYTVGSDHNEIQLNYTSISGGVSDLAGNTAGGLIGDGLKNANITIDTTSPAAPTFSGVTAGSNYFVNKTVTFTGESDAAIHISVDNGVNWTNAASYISTANDEEKTFVVLAKQADLAGNVSPVASVEFTVDVGVPVLSSITTTKTTGVYKKDDQIPVTLLFSKKVSSSSGKITFNNGSYINITNTADLKLSHSGTYTVASGNDVAKLTVSSVTGTFTAKSTATVVLGTLPSANDFESKTIVIDTTAPTVTTAIASSVSEPINDSKYYLNAGDTVELELTFSEVVRVMGSSTLDLSSGGKAYYSSGTSTNKLKYLYTVGSVDTTNHLGLSITTLPTSIKDDAGNELSTVGAKAIDKTIVVDNGKPAAPTFSGVTAGSNYFVNKTVTFTGESDAAIHISVDNGVNWMTAASYTSTANDEEKTFVVLAKQTDLAGNVSPVASVEFTVDVGVPVLSSITTTKTTGVYKTGDQIPVTLLFSKKVSSSSGKITFNNGSYINITNTADLKLSHSGTYTVASGNDVAKLTVSSVTGTFTAKSTAVVSLSTLPSANDFESKTIAIDTTAPTVTTAIASSVSEPINGSKYYLNAGDTVELELTFSEVVRVMGSSTLDLSSGGKAYYSSGTSTNKLKYLYTVGAGQSTGGLSITTLPTSIEDGAGNILSTVGTKAIDKTIVVDTTSPAAPTVSGIVDGDFSETKTFTVSGEADAATVEYSIDGGASYFTYSSSVTIGTSYQKNSYKVTSRQTDRAGNVSSSSSPINLSIDLRTMGIEKIMTSKSNGVYKAGTVIPVTIVFSKKVKINGASITLNSGGTVSLGTSATAQISYTGDYTVGSGQNTDSLKASGVGGAYYDEYDADVSVTIVASLANASNFSGSSIKIDTTVPTVTTAVASSVSEPINGSKYYLNAGDTVEFILTLSEVVNVVGTSTFGLNSSGSAVYLSGSGSNQLTYRYTVANGENIATALSLNSFPMLVQDIAGNILSTTGTMAIDKTIVVDTTSPAAPTVSITSGTNTGDIYTGTVVFAIAGGETGAVLEYSYDNGAIPHNAGGTSFNVTNSGDNVVRARQTDIAGNVSSWGTPVSITIDNAAPIIKSITTTAPDGSYGTTKSVPVMVEFDEEAVITTAMTILLNNGGTATIPVNPTKSLSHIGAYAVSSGGTDTNILAASSVTAGAAADALGNSRSSFTVPSSNFTGKTIRIDKTAPVVKRYTVDNASAVLASTLTQGVGVGSNIVLDFEEAITKGSGTITLERVYKSYPAVLTTTEYQSYIAQDSSISDYYINRCIGTVGNGGAVPDRDAKYVLKYVIDHGAYSSAPAGDAGTVWSKFDALGYNKIELDVKSGLITVSGNTLTINPAADLPQGIVFKVALEAGAITDMAGNGNAIDAGTVKFETGPCAVPVIRINKLSGQEGGSQPYTTTFKVSSETYGATMKYATSSNSSGSIPSNPSSYDTYSSPVTIGGTSTTAYIYKLWAYGTKSGLTQGGTYKELAYKTVISATNAWGFRGSDSTGGASATTEFPLSWYSDLETARATSGYVVSWHILKEFQYKPMNSAGNWWLGVNKTAQPGASTSY